MLTQLKEWYEGKAADEKRKIVLGAAFSVLAVVMVTAYYVKNGSAAERKAAAIAEAEKKPVRPDRLTFDTPAQKLLDDEMRSTTSTLQEQLAANNQKQKQELNELTRRIRQLEGQLSNKRPDPRKREEKEIGASEDAPVATTAQTPNYPIPPAKVPTGNVFNDNAGPKGDGPQPDILIGGIYHDATSAEIGDVTDKDKKKPRREIRIPPSIMKGVLLTGVDAPAMSGADKNPPQLVFYIKSLAQLPNGLKAKTAGCFAVGDGVGVLGKARVDVRLKSITCLDRKKKALIDGKVVGQVNDKDGKIGLHGQIYAHFARAMGYSLMGGTIGGLGNQAVASSQTQVISSSGSVTTTVDPTQMLQSGLGQGLGQAAEDIRKVYLELVKNELPYIEVGTMKEVDIVITKTSILKVEEYEM
jgi:conjugal transfer pilus assembly protein TraB